jgi:3-oxoacyl-[acyl-carrier protein] reductase
MNSNMSKSPAARRVAVVTGGTKGIGLGICKALLSRRIAVAAVYHSDAEAARAAETETAPLGGEFFTCKADVTKKSESTRVVEEVVKKWGGIDILVNNAGIFRFAFLESMDESFFDSLYSANLKSMFHMIQASLPWLKKSGEGRIVNASSISGRLADVGLIAYGCSKAGVDMLTRIASAELAPFGITVNAYAPGIIATEMTREMIETRGTEQRKQIPHGQFGAPEDVAELVAFLCSREAGYITGEVIGVDGGMLKVQNPARAWESAQGSRASQNSGKEE